MCKNPAMTRPSRHRVAVLALDGVVAFDLGTPPQVLGAARDEAGHQLYEVRVATPGSVPVRSSAGFTVAAAPGLVALAWADTVVVCTGAFVLAGAGLRDGRPATTHWFWADRFRRMYPDVRLDPDVLFVDD